LAGGGVEDVRGGTGGGSVGGHGVLGRAPPQLGPSGEQLHAAFGDLDQFTHGVGSGCSVVFALLRGLRREQWCHWDARVNRSSAHLSMHGWVFTQLARHFSS
jgi:hypothetical protein